MEIGSKLHQLRKMSGMTQEQLAEKLDVSRQTISKWESGKAMPDLECVVKISKMFQMSLDDLLLGEESKAEEKDAKITLEDLMSIQSHNRKMTLLLISGLIFLMVGVLGTIFVRVLYSTTGSIEYMLYRYISIGEYAYAPVDYQSLLYPSAAAGILGILLCIWYAAESRNGGKSMSKKKIRSMLAGAVVVSAAIIAGLAMMVMARREPKESNENLYGSTIANLLDDELFAIVETNTEHPVLLVTSQTYDIDGSEASIDCDVYYVVDGKVKNLGRIESFGTAYPIRYDETGLFVAGNHQWERYVIDNQHGSYELSLAEGMYVEYDSDGNETYTGKTGKSSKDITEDEFWSSFEKYNEASVIDFGYGATPD